MDNLITQKQLSKEERDYIEREVRTELTDHLYQGCLPGTIGGIPVGIALFINLYNHTPFNRLLPWYIFYNSALAALTLLYFIYLKKKNSIEMSQWLFSYSVVMCICALSWGLLSFLMPEDLVRQNFTLIALFFIATGYAAGTIGVFRLCVITLSIIVLPIVVWAILQAKLYYYLLATFALIFMPFMISINRRSTEWFKTSLKLKLENTLVSYQANHDLSTDLPNQRLLSQYIDSAVLQVTNTDSVFALLCFSVNRLDLVNDSLGHQAGDFVIKTIAERLTGLAARAKRTTQTQYNITIRKDVFNIIIVPVRTEEVEAKAQALFTVLDDSIFLEQKNVKLTGSIGISVYPQDGKDTATLLINADAAMLEAKQYGGNKLEFHRSEITAHLPKQVELETDLHDAIKHKQFVLHYQPLINIKTGHIVGMEALIRWNHPRQGFISPMNFIPIAEATSLILPIGEWVLEEACRQTKLWHDMGYNTLRVAVNLSPKQLREDKILEIIERTLHKTQLDPKSLELEITETAILDENVIPVLKQFKTLGLSLAVDDFGTGYAGLSYFKRFSINKIKIDQSFIRDIPANNDSMTIVSAIIAMAKELNVATLAEGVETVDQLNFLKSKGCDYVQGYYFSKPLEVSFFTQLLKSRRYAPAEVAHG